MSEKVQIVSTCRHGQPDSNCAACAACAACEGGCGTCPYVLRLPTGSNGNE